MNHIGLGQSTSCFTPHLSLKCKSLFRGSRLMNLSLHVTIGIPSSYPDSPSWAGLTAPVPLAVTARVQGCPTRPRPPDGPTGLLRHFTQQSFPRFRWHDGSRSSSELPFCSVIVQSHCGRRPLPGTTRSCPGGAARAPRSPPALPAAGQPG